MKEIEEVTGECISAFAITDLIVPAFAGLVRKMINKEARSVYIPHLSKMMFSELQYRVIQILQYLGLVGYFNDGMVSVSLNGILWSNGLIHQSVSDIIKWNYSFLSLSEKASAVSPVKTYLSWQVSRQKTDYKSKDFSGRVSLHSGSTSVLVIASKWINWLAVKRAVLNHAEAQIVYIPHYQNHKNDKGLVSISSVWKPYPNIELALPQQINNYFYCYFGVTSSILYVLEILKTLGVDSFTHFIPAIDHDSCNYKGEAEDFMSCLQVYSSLFAIYPVNQRYSE